MESLGDCNVQSVFSDEMLGLPAINHYSDTDINKASGELIAKHSEYFKVSNVLNQVIIILFFLKELMYL
jgi:hypothetical protein